MQQHAGYDALTRIDKLSDLVELAIADARKLDPETYEPHADRWHQPQRFEGGDGPRTGFCEVCLAGAVIAGRDLTLPRIDATPGSLSQFYGEPVNSFNRPLHARLHALDSVRRGYYRQAAIEIVPVKSYDRGEDLRLNEELRDLDRSEFSEFSGWEQFNQFLDDLERRVLPALRAAGC